MNINRGMLGSDANLTEGKLSSTPSGDIMLIHGRDNLEQALSHRIKTKVGELIFHLDYGSNMPDIISLPNTEILHGIIFIEISKICEAEPRIERVNHLSVIKERPRHLGVELDLTVIERNVPNNLLLRLEVAIGS